METEPRHQCLVYEGSPTKKLRLLALILQRRLLQGYRCMYLNSAAMVEGMRTTLANFGIDVEKEIEKGSLILSSEPVSLPHFDIEKMLGKLEDSINDAVKAGYKGLWASGDMTWEFGPSHDFSKLMDYEYRLEELFQRRKELCGICQYHQDTLPGDVMRQSLLVHPHIVINETLSRINPHYLKSSWPADLTTNQKLDEAIAQLCIQDNDLRQFDRL